MHALVDSKLDLRIQVLFKKDTLKTNVKWKINSYDCFFHICLQLKMAEFVVEKKRWHFQDQISGWCSRGRKQKLLSSHSKKSTCFDCKTFGHKTSKERIFRKILQSYILKFFFGRQCSQKNSPTRKNPLNYLLFLEKWTNFLFS